MAIEQIKETDTLNQGRIKINAILDQSNASVETVNGYKEELATGVADAKKIADDAGKDAVRIATEAGTTANETANTALANSQTAINTSNQAVSTANNNKQEFDTLRNDFDKLVAESGDSNPEIVQARTDTQGIKRTTLSTRLQADFNDRMTKADGISLFSGPTNVKKMMDFNGKTAGNTSGNPHRYFSDFTAKVLKKPSEVWNEISQTDYNKVANRDDTGLLTGSTQTGVIPQQLAIFDIVEQVKRLTPQVYEDLSRTEITKKVKDTFVSFTLGIRGKATSPNNKNIKVSTYVESTDSYTTQIQETASEYKDFTIQINDKNFITSDGYFYVVSYVDPSNGVSSSSVEIDYCGVQLEITVNGQDILTASGYAKQGDIDSAVKENVTKEKIGLGSVQNYSIASQSEAQAGKADDKYMTPLKTIQAVKSILLDLTYPIGSIYTTIDSKDPASLFGGTWERFAQGQTLVGVKESDSDFSAAEKTGGEKTHVLDITADKNKNEVGFTTPAREGVTGYGLNQVGTFSNRPAVVLNSDTSWKTNPHNNMQPYITVYMWKRVS